MTYRIEPTQGPGRELFPTRIAVALQHGQQDWLVASDTDIQATRDPVLLNGPYNAWNSSHSSSSLDVTIDTGEAFIGGAYVASDDSTVAEHTVTLAASTTGQTVHLGYDHTKTDTLLIGKSGDFPANAPRVSIWEYDTDGTGVTSATSLRPIGKRIDTHNATYDSNLNGVVDAAADADALAGRTPTVMVRDVQSAEIPITTLQNYDDAKHVEVIPAGKALKLLRVTAVDDNGNAPTGLLAQIYEPGGGDLYSQGGVTRREGTLTNPLASISGASGGRYVELQLDNETGGEIDAGMRMDYIIE